MEIVLLGTGSPIPDANRAGPATLVKVGELEHVLVDAGRGCVMRMAGAGSLPINLSGVLITHLHSDHVTDLNDVITTHWIMSQEPTPLRIWGPPGIRQFVDHTMAALAPDLTYRTEHHDDLTWTPILEVSEVSTGDRFEVGSAQVDVHETMHAPADPTIGFRIEHAGLVVALAGDTIPCPGLDRLTQDADAYVQTVIDDDLVRLIAIPRLLDILDYHSSVRQAAQVAARNKVKRLVLTHMVPAPRPEQYPAWVAAGAEHFDGEIIIGDDLTVVQLG